MTPLFRLKCGRAAATWFLCVRGGGVSCGWLDKIAVAATAFIFSNPRTTDGSA
jgi:hypothetical protein